MVFTMTSTSTVITFANPTDINVSNTRIVENYTTGDGTYVTHDTGRDSKQIVITGKERDSSSVVFTHRSNVDTLCNSGETVTIAGLSDNNLNSTYKMRSFNWSRNIGDMYTYFYSIVLERTT